MDHLQKTRKESKLKETGDLQYIYQNELGKACFQHDMTYIDFKDLTRRTASDKILLDIAENPKYDGYQEVLLQWFIDFLIKKTFRNGFKKRKYLKQRIS